MLLRRKMSRFTRTTAKFVVSAPEIHFIVGLNVQRADVESARLPRDTPSADDGHDNAALETDPT